MKIRIIPQSYLGQWSAGLGLFSILAFISGYAFAELLDIIKSDLLITILGIAAIIAAIVALVAGIIAARKNKERSVLVFLSIGFGIVVIAFIIISIFSDLLFNRPV